MIELNSNELVFRFPEVHATATCRIGFQRTLRIPDDNREYPLPAGLGRLPLEHVKNHAEYLPEVWASHGGALLPMYQAEAMWIDFRSESLFRPSYPFAIKIAAGKINAINGQPWSDTLSDQPQDYVVTPAQPWLDGFCVQKGLIRQFVAMPLGEDYTAEEQITGTAQHGGLQIVAYPMKRERYEAIQEQRANPRTGAVAWRKSSSMGLAPGGLMRQKIYRDHHGIDAWDQSIVSRCFVHILNSEQWQGATGRAIPAAPLSAADYARAGLPWFHYYADGLAIVDGAESLLQMDGVAAKSVKLGQKPLSDNEHIAPTDVIPLSAAAHVVQDGQW